MSYYKFDNTVTLHLSASDDISQITQWCDEFVGLSWYSSQHGTKKWAAKSVPYHEDNTVLVQLSVSFANETDATLFALRWVK